MAPLLAFRMVGDGMSAAITDRMTDTPRTDAAALLVREGGKLVAVVSAELASQLERELAIANGLEQMAYDQRDKAFAAQAAYQRAYKYLQDRLQSIGYHGWAHDMDGEIAGLEKS